MTNTTKTTDLGTDCKSVKIGSIPIPASNKNKDLADRGWQGEKASQQISQHSAFVPESFRGALRPHYQEIADAQAERDARWLDLIESGAYREQVLPPEPDDQTPADSPYAGSWVLGCVMAGVCISGIVLILLAVRG